MIKNPLAMQDTQVWSRIRKMPWRMATHSSILPQEAHRQKNLASNSPWWSQRIRHNWETNTFTFIAYIIILHIHLQTYMCHKIMCTYNACVYVCNVCVCVCIYIYIYTHTHEMSTFIVFDYFAKLFWMVYSKYLKHLLFEFHWSWTTAMSPQFH